jgi:hypothetical protein
MEKGVVSGFEIERWGLERWHGWWLCRLSLCERSPKFSWERKLEERVYIYIIFFPFLFLKKNQAMFVF